MANVYIYRLVIYTIIGPCISILGIIGNILCLLAIWYRNYHIKVNKTHSKGQSNSGGMGCRMYIFILWLAVGKVFLWIYLKISGYLNIL